MATDKIWTQGEITDAIKSKAQSSNLDSFRVRINRKSAPHLQPDILATFDEVTTAHLLGPELWLLELFGGGAFELTASHTTDPNSALPGPLKFTYDPSNFPLKKPNYEQVVMTLSQSVWLGPTKLIFPRPPSAPPGIVTQTIVPGVGVTQITAGEKQFQTTLSNTNTVGGAAVAPLTAVMGSTTNPVERQEASRLMQVSESLERRDRELFEKQIEMKMESLRPAQASAGPGVMEIMTAVTPLVLQFLQSKQQMETMMFQAQQESTKQQMAMMQLMMAPKPMDPELRILLEHATKKDDGSQLKGMAEMMGTMANVSMQIIQTNAEMMAASQPQQESPAYKLARQALVSLSAIMGNSKAQLLPDVEGEEMQQALPESVPMQGAPIQQFGPRKYSQLELLERALKRKDSKEVVAERFVKALKSKKFIAFVHAQYKGNFLNLVQDRLGAWAAEEAENLEYLQAVIPFIWEAADKAKLVPNATPSGAQTAPVQPASEPEKSVPEPVQPTPSEEVQANGASTTETPVAPPAPKRVKASSSQNTPVA